MFSTEFQMSIERTKYKFRHLFFLIWIKVTVVASAPVFIHEMCDYVKLNHIDAPSTIREWLYGGAVAPGNTPTRLKEELNVQCPRQCE